MNTEEVAQRAAQAIMVRPILSAGEIVAIVKTILDMELAKQQQQGRSH